MTVNDLLLTLLGVAPTVPASNTPESRNATIIASDGSPAMGTTTTGALQHAAGGLVQATSPTPLRQVAVIGFGASLRGIARKLLPQVNAAAGGSPLTDVELTHALYAYNATPLAVGNSAPIPAMPQMTWRVGQHVTLPVEMGPTGSWVTDLAKVRQWAIAPPAQKQWGLDHPAAELSIPPPEDTTAAIAAVLAGSPPVATLATTLRDWLLGNPYEHVFDMVELFRQFQSSRPVEVTELVLGCCEGLGQTGLRLSAWGTGGSVTLRRFWRLLDGNLPANLHARGAVVRPLLADALGLVPDGSGGWRDYTAYGPTVVPAEPPLTSKQARPAGAKASLSAMALGRVVPVGNEATYSGWVGPGFEGTVDPVEWLTRHPAVKGTTLGPPGNPALGVPVSADKVAERMEVAVRITGNEGFLDACRARDGGLLSAGMQQWSAHNNAELSVLLERFRVFAEDHYDMLFGVHGLQTQLSGPASGNPFALDPTKPTEYFPSSATFLQLERGQPAAEMPVQLKDHPERRRFFGAPDASSKHFAPDWCARVRLAALCSTDYNTIQLQTAAWRFTRIDLDPPVGAGTGQGPTRTRVEWAGYSFTLDVMLTSTYAAALVLDAHINSPGHVTGARGDLQRAAERTHGSQPLTTAQPDPAWLRRFATDYMAIRRFSDTTSKPVRDRLIHSRLDAATDPNATPGARARGLSPDPGTFTGLAPR